MRDMNSTNKQKIETQKSRQQEVKHKKDSQFKEFMEQARESQQ
jgi:hypothetical protein